MARNKDRDKKEFLIAQRKKVGPGYMNTPVWIIQKAGKRIWNRRQKRNWRETEFGSKYRSLQIDLEREKLKSGAKSGKRGKSTKFNKKNRLMNRNTNVSKHQKPKKK